MAAAQEITPRMVYTPISEDCVGSTPAHDGVLLEEGSQTGVWQQTSRIRRTAALMLGAAAVAATGKAFLGGAGRTQLRHIKAHLSPEVKEEIADAEATWIQNGSFPSLAPPMDVDYEYEVEGGWGTNYDHIPDPEMCAAMCQGEPKCNAYTWVKDAGLEGCPSQCWLKSGVGTKVPKKGLVSGVPPARKQLPNVDQTVKSAAGNSMYCYSLMVPGGVEPELLKWQYDNSAGIFACDQAAVYSNKAIELVPGVVAKVVNSTLKCEYGGDSQSALNAWIFIAVWQKLIEVGDYKSYDWVVKADPDAVFFPARLSVILTEHRGAAYINNCKYGMHGPIEVFSSGAITTLAADYHRSWDGQAPKKCVSEQHFGQWGEDMFIDQCLGKILEVKPRPLEEKLMCESHCDCPSWYWCQESPDMVSYHPFKTVDAYKTCMANALTSASLQQTVQVRPTLLQEKK